MTHLENERIVLMSSSFEHKMKNSSVPLLINCIKGSHQDLVKLASEATLTITRHIGIIPPGLGAENLTILGTHDMEGQFCRDSPSTKGVSLNDICGNSQDMEIAQPEIVVRSDGFQLGSFGKWQPLPPCDQCDPFFWDEWVFKSFLLVPSRAEELAVKNLRTAVEYSAVSVFRRYPHKTTAWRHVK